MKDEYRDLSEEDRLIQKEILRNYVIQTKKSRSKRFSGEEESSRLTNMKMTHDGERLSSNRISTFYKGELGEQISPRARFSLNKSNRQ